MKDLLRSFGVAFCGLITSVLVALADVAFARHTDFDLFTFSIWLIVPVGAVFTGFAAAYGYYFGSVRLHKRPTRALLLQMVAIAGVTQLLIYWLGYESLTLDDGSKVSDLVTFGQYMDVTLTKAHYRVGRSLTDTGEVGSFGYWIAGAHFLGFLFGGLVVYGLLLIKPICNGCNLYLQTMARKQKVFADPEAASAYYDRLFTLPVDGPEFAALVRTDAKVDKAQPGAMRVHTSLHACPACKNQLVKESVDGYNGSSWKDIADLSREVNLPPGVDLVPVFRD